MPGTYSAQGAAIANIDQLLFPKGYLFATIDGHTTDSISYGAIQNISAEHAFTFSEMRGPESLAALGVGVQTESVNGSWENGVIDVEQYVLACGGSMSYNAGTNKTTYTKKVDQEPLTFDIHALSGPTAALSDFEAFFYRCLSPSMKLVDLKNREWSMGGGSFNCYGQDVAAGGKLFEIVRTGNRTNSS